jgi:hypothetical protein
VAAVAGAGVWLHLQPLQVFHADSL